MITRYASAIATGTLVTLTLLFIMQLLITMNPITVGASGPRHTVEFIKRLIRDTKAQPQELLPKKQELTRQLKEPARIPSEHSEHSVRVPIEHPPQPSPNGLPSMTGFNDGPLVTMVRVQPVYPARALNAEMEGYVLLRFDVSPEGRAINISLLESTHNVFDKSAIAALMKFRFKPRVVDGVAQMTYGVQNRFTFEIDR